MHSQIRYVKQKILNRKHAIINGNWQHGNAGAGEADRTQRRWCWHPGIGLVCWAIFNVLATIAAINYAASGDWANFSEFCMGALLSWIRFAIAASGKVPSRDFAPEP